MKDCRGGSDPHETDGNQVVEKQRNVLGAALRLKDRKPHEIARDQQQQRHLDHDGDADSYRGVPGPTRRGGMVVDVI